MSEQLTSGASRTDVCILGAGLAGLTLALQLKQRAPDLDVVVVEHRRFPMAEATHKVGESTVEIAAHYLSCELGLGDHLRAEQLPKFGLRLFFRGQAPIRDDLADYDELGASRTLPVPTYQLDRGRFENHLAVRCRGLGVRLWDGVTAGAIQLQPGRQRLTLRSTGTRASHRLQARHLVDASGRRALLRQKCELARPARHDKCAVWFRIDGALELDDWSRDGHWQQRCSVEPRRLSTNHFTGPGYWLWLIPLASNTTSVGLVYDPRLVNPALVRKHCDLLRWLAIEHPLVAARLEGRAPLDYLVRNNYAVASSQVFSAEGWMTTGDAGVFADPLYSPGADFIAMANGYITDLILADDLNSARYQAFQHYFFSFFTNTLSLYRGQYAGLGDRDLMVVKTLWDYSYYWAILARLYFSGAYRDLAFLDSEKDSLIAAAGLNAGMQKQFRALAARGRRVGGEGRFFDHHAVTSFHRLKSDLLVFDEPLTGHALHANVDTLERAANSVRSLLAGIEAGDALPPLDQLVGFA